LKYAQYWSDSGPPRISVKASTPNGTPLPPATVDPIIASQGEYYYDRYLYFRIGGGTQSPDGSWEPAFESGVTERWWGVDDSGRLRFSDRDDRTYGPGSLPRETETGAFPTDPEQLLEFLLDRSAPIRTFCTGGDRAGKLCGLQVVQLTGIARSTEDRPTEATSTIPPPERDPTPPQWKDTKAHGVA